MGFADRILLSTSDRVIEADLQRLRERLARINRRAPPRPVQFGATPIAELLELSSAAPSRWTRAECISGRNNFPKKMS